MGTCRFILSLKTMYCMLFSHFKYLFRESFACGIGTYFKGLASMRTSLQEPSTWQKTKKVIFGQLSKHIYDEATVSDIARNVFFFFYVFVYIESISTN